MGYTTDFEGRLYTHRPLAPETARLFNGLARTRRMRRSASKLAERLGISTAEAEARYGGPECPLYYPTDSTQFGQERSSDIVDYNSPPQGPQGQPGLWLQWEYREEDGRGFVEWNGAEKFYWYVEWLAYVLVHVIPEYELTGCITWVGEDPSDWGMIEMRGRELWVGRSPGGGDSQQGELALVGDYVTPQIEELRLRRAQRWTTLLCLRRAPASRGPVTDLGELVKRMPQHLVRAVVGWL